LSVAALTTLDVPVVGSDVKFCPGAKILGPIIVGDGAIIAANAVVVDDCAAGRSDSGGQTASSEYVAD
jgi:serine acetyltransferase